MNPTRRKPTWAGNQSRRQLRSESKRCPRPPHPPGSRTIAPSIERAHRRALPSWLKGMTCGLNHGRMVESRFLSCAWVSPVGSVGCRSNSCQLMRNPRSNRLTRILRPRCKRHRWTLAPASAGRTAARQCTEHQAELTASSPDGSQSPGPGSVPAGALTRKSAPALRFPGRPCRQVDRS